MTRTQPIKRETPIISNESRARQTLQAYGHTIGISKKAMPLVEINAPSFFKDPDFLKLLNDPQQQVATWHSRDTEPGDCSDVFIYHSQAYWHDNELCAYGTHYDYGANGGLPEHIIAVIAEAVQHATGSMNTECLIWITNLN